MRFHRLRKLLNGLPYLDLVFWRCWIEIIFFFDFFSTCFETYLERER